MLLPKRSHPMKKGVFSQSFHFELCGQFWCGLVPIDHLSKDGNHGNHPHEIQEPTYTTKMCVNQKQIMHINITMHTYTRTTQIGKARSYMKIVLVHTKLVI